MKKELMKSIALFALMATVAMPLSVHALAVEIGGNAGVEATGKNNSTKENNTAGVTSKSSLGIDVEIDGSSETETTSNSTSSNTSTHENTESINIEAIVVTRADVQNKENSSVDSPTAVENRTTLSSYAHAVVASDENISKVRFEENDEVSLWYKQHGKFIGFIPMTLHAKATVDEKGEVNLSYPWYGFLTTTNDEKLEADLEARARTVLQTEGTATANTEAKLSARTQAQLLAEMRTVMKQYFDTQVQAHTEASSRVEVNNN